MEYGSVEVFKLLANDVRFKVLLMLNEAPKGVPAGVISEHCEVSPSAASQQLTLLKMAGFVTVERRGTAMIYRLATPVHPLVAAAFAYDAGREA
jgi:DNA-binding transcriptional ArsR family regulator